MFHANGGPLQAPRMFEHVEIQQEYTEARLATTTFELGERWSLSVWDRPYRTRSGSMFIQLQRYPVRYVMAQ